MLRLHRQFQVLQNIKTAFDSTRYLATSTTDANSLRSALSYCVNQVKLHDYENYVWAVQLPHALRTPSIVLRAFDIETNLIADHARTEMLILMRCQWWRDAINSCYKGTPPNQPVITALSNIIQKHALTRYRLQRIVTTKEQDLISGSSPDTLAALEELAEGTTSQLLYLQLEAADIKTDTSVEHVASHLGKAIGMTSVLRNALTFAQRGRCYLPRDICEAKGVQPEDVLKGKPTEGIKDATLEVASAAKAHLDHARSLSNDVPASARPLFLSAVGCSMYLKALEKCNFDMFDPSLQAHGGISPLGYQLRLKWYMLRKSF